MLAAVADFISRAFRPFDDAYRLGGEEFLDLPEGSRSGRPARKYWNAARANLEKMPITLANGPTINITASFGLVASTDDVSVEEMLHRADQALYRAKNQGRNAIVVLDTTI